MTETRDSRAKELIYWSRDIGDDSHIFEKVVEVEYTVVTTGDTTTWKVMTATENKHRCASPSILRMPK